MSGPQPASHVNAELKSHRVSTVTIPMVLKGSSSKSDVSQYAWDAKCALWKPKILDLTTLGPSPHCFPINSCAPSIRHAIVPHHHRMYKRDDTVPDGEGTKVIV